MVEVDHVFDDQVQILDDQVVDEGTEVGQGFDGVVLEDQVLDRGVEVDQVVNEVVFEDQVLVVLLMDVLVKVIVEVVQLVVVSGTGGVCKYPQLLVVEVLEVELVLVGHECTGHEMDSHDLGCRAASTAAAVARMRTKGCILKRFAMSEVEIQSRNNSRQDGR